MDVVDGLLSMTKSFCRNPKCRKTFEIPESSQEKPRLCPECRAKERGIQVSEETCVIEGCGNPRREGKARCNKHQKEYQNESYRKSKRAKEAGQKPARKTPAHPPKKEDAAPRRYHIGLEDFLALVPKIRDADTEREAVAYLEGFFEARKIIE